MELVTLLKLYYCVFDFSVCHVLVCGLRSVVFPGPEVIKLEFILRLGIKRNDWLLGDTCP